MTTWCKFHPHPVQVPVSSGPPSPGPPSPGPSSNFFRFNCCKTLLPGHFVSILDTKVHFQQNSRNNLIKIQIKLCQSAQVHHSTLSLTPRHYYATVLCVFPLLHLLFHDEPNHNDLLCALQRNQGHLLFPLLGAAFSGHEDPALASPLPLLQQGQYLPFRTLFDLLPEHCPVHKKSSINIC